ncbi:peptidoglycan recognition protein family protein [Methylopila sp. Yamaguchi]|uniref:peptidoglycan recognition protein family protein n=1 Tax=Methylopila sp. Yamaguchi TaxID=1437817 RepID=UPI000CCC97E7|nr:N-acetylmuramoyl-L-alanine amidase [Methylopila sp. Yamaguchi]
MSVEDVQRRLKALGYTIGTAGPNRDGVDGDFGRLSQLATLAALVKGAPAPADAPSPPPGTSATKPSSVPASWMPAALIKGIVVHWTAGAHRASALDRSHYHLLIEADGKLVRGTPSIDLNDARGLKSGYAAHTLKCNSGFIGVSLCCMAGAVESPFKAGPHPMTRAQWDELPAVLADLCRRYDVPITPRTVLSHAEVQGTLGITQRGKWDISRLAFDPSVVGAKAVGDLFRKRAAALLANPSEA